MSVDGDAKVVLQNGKSKFPVPGDVPPGSYHILATFPGESQVDVGKVTVGDAPVSIKCNADMGLCRAK